MPSIFRQLRLATFAFLALLSVGLVVSAALTVYEQRRLRAARAQIDRLQEFERVYLVVSEHLLTWRHVPLAQLAGRPELVRQINRLATLSGAPETPVILEMVRLRVLQIGGIDPQTRVQLDAAMLSERQHGENVLLGLESKTDLQLKLELAAPLAVLAVGILLLPLARRRIIRPLDMFGARLARLADGDFRPLPLEGVDEFLLPLHRQLNAVAQRLQELEAEHAEREHSLENKVRSATGRLLDQQRTLARAERLAATGELAASVAHELRNPLAGIQITLANLRADFDDPELVERVDLVSNEVARLTRLLNSLLDSARHTPEAPRPIRLAEQVDELFALTRVQLPDAVRLTHGIDRSLTCRLPADRLRQALLNLLLNAGAALGSQGGTVHVDAAVGDDGRLRIAVEDDGPGFPAELLEGGIRPFFSTREHGTGLGLAMVRRFARELGGDIALEARAPHGARVRISLPLDAQQL
ncbi:MAG: ATP-binding protein [Deltaproteobacteria bacterium]|nr:ATP-binding protein [Deltaproteobacteria bacterium]